MNANIFSCTVPPLLVLETQIIHLELLQSLCTNPYVPLGSIFLVDVCARAEACAGAHRWVRAGADRYGRAQTSTSALTCLRPRAPVCVRPYSSAPALTRLRPPLPICARAHPSARDLLRLRTPSASVDLGLTRQLH